MAISMMGGVESQRTQMKGLYNSGLRKRKLKADAEQRVDSGWKSKSSACYMIVDCKITFVTEIKLDSST